MSDCFGCDQLQIIYDFKITVKNYSDLGQNNNFPLKNVNTALTKDTIIKNQSKAISKLKSSNNFSVSITITNFSLSVNIPFVKVLSTFCEDFKTSELLILSTFLISSIFSTKRQAKHPA